ncbi:GntR family transcriptional regulator [Sphingobium aquiterrae]|uniref:GntR family transcriptional regulator n=1 Tax=Sphingobium aquiterrae TaxID=2038656 RepID=UPI00301A2A5B
MQTQNIEADDTSISDHMPSTLRTHLVKTLRSQILSGRYKPGDRLNESQIAREFNISRIPVREALSQLQEQGLVMNHERRGMFVIQLSSDEVQQINSLRLVLEAEAMRLARARMTPEILAELTELVEQMEAWDGPLIDAAALDRKFHAVIWHAAGNPYLERTLNSLTTSLFAHKALEHVSQEIRRWRLNHHRALLDLVSGGNDDDPQFALLTHLRMAYSEPERFSSLALTDAHRG